jgi:hypothetical protein
MRDEVALEFETLRHQLIHCLNTAEKSPRVNAIIKNTIKVLEAIRDNNDELEGQTDCNVANRTLDNILPLALLMIMNDPDLP